MKPRLLIVGAGGFGREVLQWAEDIVAEGADWTLAGFLDGNQAALDGFDCAQEIVGSPESHVIAEQDLFVCAIGDPVIRERVSSELSRRGARFATLVHPTAIIGARSTIDEGSIICPRVTITVDVQIGRHVVINTLSTIGHDVTIGDYCSLFSHCDVTGGARLETGVTMGSHSSVLPGVRVGESARISAGSIVTRRVRPGTTVFGVPAKKLLGGDSASRAA